MDTAKEDIRRLLDPLPDDASFEDIAAVDSFANQVIFKCKDLVSIVGMKG